jgi:hypothetical protein
MNGLIELVSVLRSNLVCHSESVSRTSEIVSRALASGSSQSQASVSGPTASDSESVSLSDSSGVRTQVSVRARLFQAYS